MRLNYPGTNEKRCIVRQAHDFYRTLVVGGIYSCSNISSSEDVKNAFVGALIHCVSAHSILSATISGEETEAPAFVRPATLNLNDHIEIVDKSQLANTDSDSSETECIKLVLQKTHDTRFVPCDKVPSWKIVVFRLTSERFLILFAYYHSHGDGKSGLAFHRSFLEGLRFASDRGYPRDAKTEIKSPDKPLLPTMEDAGKLTISWSYLLSPVISIYLPKFITQTLNMRASVTPESPDQWRGHKTCYDPASFRTGVEILSVDNEKMRKVLDRCRNRSTKFTGLLHQFIIRALSENVPADAPAGSFVSQTAVDLRRHLEGITDNDMALCPTAYYELFSRNPGPEMWNDWTASGSESTVWAAARATTEGLVQRVETLHDQPVGLLKYLDNFHSWTTNQIGSPRGSSYELSNLLSFNPSSSSEKGSWEFEEIVFSQPANAVGSALSFNVVTRKGAAMTLILTWQLGVLDVEDEEAFAARICGSIGASIDELANA